jgi:hypothetical protein
MARKLSDVMILPEKEFFMGFEKPASAKDDPFWFFDFWKTSPAEEVEEATVRDEDKPN